MRVTIVSTWFPTEVSAGLGIFVARHAAPTAAPGPDTSRTTGTPMTRVRLVPSST